MIFRIFHLFSSPLDTFVITGEISRNLVFFSTHLIYQQGNESHHLLSLVARAARCPEKNGKTQEAREIKASRSFARANDRVCHDFNFLFFLSLSLSSPLFFFPSFSSFIYTYIYTDDHALNVLYVLPGLFTFCPVAGRAYIVRSSGRKNLQREIEFLYGLLVAPSGFTGQREIIAFDRTHNVVKRKACEKVISLSLSFSLSLSLSLSGVKHVKRF